MKLNAINDEGVECELLAPLFRALLPAFTARAKEMRIESDDSIIRISYDGDSSTARFDSPLHNYGVIAFSRILILSKMNIALEAVEQSGRFRVRFGKQLLPIDVASQRDDKGWQLVFRPAWTEAKADVVNELST